jgi:cytidylate kinase
LKRISIIAIDGPTASGKSTIGGLLAERLGYVYFDTGVMYRAVTWATLQRGVAIHDEAGVTGVAESVVINVTLPTINDGRQYTVLADGQDITWEIRRPDIEAHVSPVSAYRGVRQALTLQQRRIGNAGKIVMVGRDIGTVVLPNADVKLYLDASLEERAGRRYREKIQRGERVTMEEVLAAVRRRDQFDSSRELAPLRPADDAILIDTEGLGVEAVLERVMAVLRDP